MAYEDRPMFSQLLKTNYKLLLRCLDPSSTLLARLMSDNFLRERIWFIRSHETKGEKVKAMLDELLDVPQAHELSVANTVIRAMILSDKEHVANIFRETSVPVSMSYTHYDRISKNRKELRHFIEPRDGLIDHLISSGTFTEIDRSDILDTRRDVAVNETADEVLNVLLRKPDSAFDEFLNALNKTAQSHVVYIITGVGDDPPMTVEHRKVLRKKMNDIRIYADAENGLLDKLYSDSVVTDSDAQRIRSAAGYNAVVRKLVETL